MTDSTLDVTIVAVTFNRADFLRDFLNDIAQLDPAPSRVIVVDNASTDDTPEVIEAAREKIGANKLINHRLDHNTGGSGGFHHGTKLALELGAPWVWLMDDDIELMQDALALLEPWTSRFSVLHGKRYDHDWTPFRWQPYLSPKMALPHRKTPEFDADGSAHINSGTFEGMLVCADVFDTVGLPDERFFIVWDDVVFGWKANALGFAVGYVDEFVLRRRRKQEQTQFAGRRVNHSNALYRYHVMRNRKFVAEYLREQHTLHPVAFHTGTALIFAKEVVRLVRTGRTVRGVGDLVRGLRASW